MVVMGNYGDKGVAAYFRLPALVNGNIKIQHAADKVRAYRLCGDKVAQRICAYGVSAVAVFKYLYLTENGGWLPMITSAPASASSLASVR